MAQLVFASDAAYTRARRSWQDTSAPPNVLLRHQGPGLTSLALQRYVDVANQTFHRDSMKGQTADIPNLQPLFHLAAPPLLAKIPDETSGEVVHRDSMKGQTADPENWLLGFGLLAGVAGAPRVMVINPVFNKRAVQDTNVQRNPVLDLNVASTLPVIQAPFENEQAYHRDTLSGQYGRSGAVVVIGVPPAFNEIYTFVPKPKPAQEPYLFPNAVILGIPATASPFVQRQTEDHQWRGKKTQEPFDLANILIRIKPVSFAFVQRQTEDHQWRGKKTQETYDFPNVIIKALTPTIIRPFVQSAISDLQWRGKITQETFDFPNIIPFLPPIIPPTFRVMAVTAGWYNGRFRTPGDVFDLLSSLDYSPASIDYQPPSSNTTGYGWMIQVAPSTPLFDWLQANNAPYLPPQDPSRRFIM